MEVDINQIQPNRYNPKNTEDYAEEYQAILEGIREMGMKTPIDVREIDGDIPYEIIDGFHRWKACKDEGWKEIPISSWGKINEIQAKKITILKEKARIPLDLIKTSKILNELAHDTSLDELVKQIGYSLPDLKEDLEIMKFNWDSYEKKGEDGEELKENIKTLNVIMTESQHKVVSEAIKKAKEEGETDSEARALELICGDYLSGS